MAPSAHLAWQRFAESIRRSGSAGAVRAMGYRIAGMSASLALSVSIARWGGAQAKGEFSLFTAQASLCGAFLSMGLALQVVRETRTADATLSVRATFLRSIGVLTAAVGLLAALLTIFGSAHLAEVLVGGYLYVVPAQAGIVALACRGALVSNRGALLQPLGGLFILAVLVAAGSEPLRWVIVAVAVLSYLAPLPYFLSVIPRPGATPSFAWVGSRIFRRGLLWQPGRLAQYALMRADLIVVGLMLGVVPAGVYSIALSLAELGLMLPRVLAADSLHSAVKGESVKPTTLARRNALFSAGCGLLLLAVSPIATPFLYGPGFSDVPGILLVLLPGAVAFSVSQVGIMYANVLGALRASTSVTLTSGLVFGVIIWPLVSWFGEYGAAAASSVAYVSMATGFFVWLRGVPAGARLVKDVVE